MTWLVFGLIIFLGVHSVRIVAEGWRTRAIQQIGLLAYKAAYSVLSALGLALIIWGFGSAREMPVMLWLPPVAMRIPAAVLTLTAFVLLAAAYVPGNFIKARVHHPMAAAVKVWAFAHLISTGSMAHVVLFGSFMVWAVLDYRAARRRDRVLGTQYAPATALGNVTTLMVGGIVWAVVAFALHGLLIGIKPVV